jgi:predicted ribosome quality control (RQC) complex YloA/Tae2 family protein
VDYTEIKYVHKPAGAKPGFVIYDRNRTAYVDPDPKLAEKLKNE